MLVIILKRTLEDKSYNQFILFTVRANEGDSYPLGSLPIGSLVSSVQVLEGHPGSYACAAGCTALLLRKLGDQVIVRLPSKQEVTISSKCTATVGRVSNIDHNRRVLGKAGAKRQLGIRPKSGRWHRKHPSKYGFRPHRKPKQMKVYVKPREKTYDEVVLGRSIWSY